MTMYPDAIWVTGTPTFASNMVVRTGAQQTTAAIAKSRNKVLVCSDLIERLPEILDLLL